MSEQNYVILSDGEKYPVESLIDINAMQQIPGCSCGISLNKETYNTDNTVIEVQEVSKKDATQAMTIEQLQLYLEMLKPPKAPEKLQREPLWCHKLLYIFYDVFDTWFDDVGVLVVLLLSGVSAVVGLIASAFGAAFLGVWLFVTMIVLLGLSYLVVYSADSYVPKKKAYWLDIHNYKLVPCTVCGVYAPDNTNVILYVLMQTDYVKSKKIVSLRELVFAEEEISMWAKYFYAYKQYLDNYNTTMLSMYYPKYAEDKLFLQFIQSNARYKEGKLYKVGDLMQKYIQYMKELQADGVRQKNVINDLQAELENVMNGTCSETEKKKHKTKSAKYVK